MKLSSTQLRQMMESLPNPDRVNAERYHVLIPRVIDPVMNKSFAPLRSSKREEEPEWIFTRERRYNGWQWTIEIDLPESLYRQLMERIRYQTERGDSYELRFFELQRQLSEEEARHELLLKKWYIKLGLNISCFFKSLKGNSAFYQNFFMSVFLTLGIVFGVARLLHLL